ncbi:anti-sigma factor antagonist [Mycolicibacterium madagascariense]|uniref:Anti-sigma factor antagonist n=1 Tax=Mycolicibacterium madagascariense TaxID=212765 RepID=A0A7I7XK34_9MYCO|nr:STAS domain-containing protein [Mycolicibacterium madagascariense]MCV7011227.1 STAS domain-containing protein [Mycolicibacterium madagascariense]BBZ29579.1 anti-sigma factor antagonist [Mycolicibacterium madagascariense]
MTDSTTVPESPVTDPANDSRSGFGVHAKTSRDVVVVSATGDVDALTAPRLQDAITEALGVASTALVVDLTEVEFLSSAGMSVLMAGYRQADPELAFCVVADGPFTDRPMRMIGLDRELRLYPTLSSALEDLR